MGAVARIQDSKVGARIKKRGARHEKALAGENLSWQWGARSSLQFSRNIQCRTQAHVLPASSYRLTPGFQLLFPAFCLMLIAYRLTFLNSDPAFHSGKVWALATR